MKTLFASRASTKQRNRGRPLSAVNAPQLPGTAGPLRLHLGTRTLTFYSCRAGAGAGGGAEAQTTFSLRKQPQELTSTLIFVSEEEDTARHSSGLEA